MYNVDKNRITFTVMSVNEFAVAKELSVKNFFVFT
jgi:hypothetical protein